MSRPPVAVYHHRAPGPKEVPMSHVLRLSVAACGLLLGGAALAYDDSGRFPSQFNATQPKPPAQAQATSTAGEVRCTTKRVQARNASGAVVSKQQRTCR
jgi:hypothetical protein